MNPLAKELALSADGRELVNGWTRKLSRLETDEHNEIDALVEVLRFVHPEMIDAREELIDAEMFGRYMLKRAHDQYGAMWGCVDGVERAAYARMAKKYKSQQEFITSLKEADETGV